MSQNRIAWGQKPCITVITAKDPTPSEKYAAEELRNYLNLMTSAVIPLAADENIPGPVIAVGRAAARLGVTADDGLGEDGFTVKTVGDSLAIVGGVRGVLYGVYAFLEQLGCRFFTPLAEKVPSRPELELPQLDMTQVPVLEYREHNLRQIEHHPRFAAKLRLNGGNLPDYLGGGVQYLWFVHTFDTDIIPPEEYFDEHPEYFCLVDGKRIGKHGQPCLTNPEVLAIAIEKVRAALRAHPECRIISVSQNDNENNCRCEKCAALDKEQGSSAGSLITFVNALAEAIEEEFPQVIIDTLAYQYTRPATKTLRPRHNVCVRLCSIECCFAHSYEDCDDETRLIHRPDGTTGNFIGDLRAWGKVCDRLYVWDYTTCFSHYPAPHPNWHILQPNIRAMVKNGVKGVFEQACGAQGGSTDMNELRAYVISRLLWDPETDVETHIREFTDFFYGAAAPYIREYIRVHTQKVIDCHMHISYNSECDRPDMTNEMLDIYDDLLKKGEAAVAGDPIRAMRVARVRLSIRWVRMKNNAMLRNIHDPEEINQFFEDWRAHGLTRIDEWVSPETTHRALLENVWRGIEYYSHWADEGPERP